MIIRIGDITAACPQCGGTEFESFSAGPLRLASELKCSACGAKVKYLLLLDQIGEEAMQRANKAIDELKRRPGRPDKPKR
jgi:DNA-directed RNA polymerase subunit RPC12/RpoP